MKFQSIELIKFEKERIQKTIKDYERKFENISKVMNIRNVLNDLVYIDNMINTAKEYLKDLTEYEQIKIEELKNEQNNI